MDENFANRNRGCADLILIVVGGLGILALIALGWAYLEQLRLG